jgi:Putative Flp pilus-assembly TadE/G-like
MSRLTQLLRRDRAEDGAVIVIVAVLLACILGAAALAIDLSSGRQAEQAAQTGADAAAAAGADQISATGTTPVGPVLSAATSEAVANGACATCVQVTYPYLGDTTKVGVSISGASAGTVGGKFGRSSIPVSASAVAAADNTVTVTPGVVSTTVTHGSNAIFYAADTSCSGGITMNGDSGTIITGETFSNGGIHLDKPSDYTFNGSVSYNSTCSNPGIPGAHAATPVSGWPEDFTPAAVPESTICAGTTIQSANITISSDRTFNGPICTTGTITITGTSNLSGRVTFVASQITLDGNSGTNITPYYQDLLFYQTGTGQMKIINGSAYPGGTIFVPNGSLLIDGDSNFGENAPPGYIEAQDIVVTSSSGTIIHGKGTGAANTTSTTTGLPVTSTVPLGSSLVQ